MGTCCQASLIESGDSLFELQLGDCKVFHLKECKALIYNSRAMGEKQSAGGPNRSVLIKALVSLLMMGGGAILVSILWVFQRIHDSLGSDLAELGVALISILILALVLLGMRAGLSMDRYMRQRRLEKFRIYQSSRRVRDLCTVLGYGGSPPAPALPQPETEEMLALMDKPRRRGRPPTYSIDRWKRVVLAWENRDPLHNPLTLAEFLAEQFGVYADGSPHMSENSYYDWRKKVFEEIRRETEGRQVQTE